MYGGGTSSQMSHRSEYVPPPTRHYDDAPPPPPPQYSDDNDDDDISVTASMQIEIDDAVQEDLEAEEAAEKARKEARQRKIERMKQKRLTEERDKRNQQQQEMKRRKRGHSPSVNSFSTPYSQHGQSIKYATNETNSVKKSSPVNSYDGDSDGEEIEQDDGGSLRSNTINEYETLISNTFNTSWQKNHEFVFVTSICRKTKKEKRALRWRRFEDGQRKTTDLILKDGALNEEQFRRIKRDQEWFELLKEAQENFEREKERIRQSLRELKKKDEYFKEIQQRTIEDKKGAMRLLRALNPQIAKAAASSTSAFSSTTFRLTSNQCSLLWIDYEKEINGVERMEDKLNIVREYVLFKKYVIDTYSSSNKRNYLNGFKQIWMMGKCSNLSVFEYATRTHQKQNNNMCKASVAYQKFLNEKEKFIRICGTMDIRHLYE